ncbi:phosphotransferase [Clostridium estertheticum]|uniref:aminoglycoside phosphotransferase family protein n=1 Tax=Clostridium estertheticum TaxID=238834 RepID=UPI0013E980DE|nr:phosphotransferase [Clostridium estertheticum]MBZ9687455.1 phosphotransferase [Clostridium estertheticum]
MNIFEDVSGYSQWSIVSEIEKGWSNDKKYYIQDKYGQEFLLRVSDISELEKKSREYENLGKISELNINMSMPLKFGVCGNNSKVFSLLSWVHGDDAEKVLPTLTKEEQYGLGVESGEILAKIHSIPAPEGFPNWSETFNRKIDRNINNYNNCYIKIPNGEKIIKYILDNRDLLNSRKQSIQHGDYHVGNLLVNKNNKIGVIDFNRYGFGDPWEEFNRISFSHSVSIPFTIGQIEGYFSGNVPNDFFKLLALYMGSNALSSISWAIPFGEKEVNVMLTNSNNMMEYYKDFKTFIPTWFKSSKCY